MVLYISKFTEIEAYIRRVPFQLECGKKFGINFRIIAPGIMDTELFRALNDSLTVPMAELETYCPKEDLDSLEYVYQHSADKVFVDCSQIWQLCTLGQYLE